MSKEHRSLMMRSNRLLGAALVEHNLVKIEALEAANERLIELSSGDQPRQSTILGILAYDMKVVKEDHVLHYAVEADGIGMVDLQTIEVPDEVRNATDIGMCWATWTVPFDKEEEFWFVASAYYLSPAVRTHWEKQLGGHVLWYGTTLEMVAEYLEKLAARPPAPTGAPAATATS
jgi:hypothetical protein